MLNNITFGNHSHYRDYWCCIVNCAPHEIGSNWLQSRISDFNFFSMKFNPATKHNQSSISYILDGRSIDSLSLSFLSLLSATSGAQSVITRRTESSGGSFATPQPLSTNVAPSSRDQASNTLVVERTNQVTQTPPSQNLNLLNSPSVERVETGIQTESSIRMQDGQHHVVLSSALSAREPGIPAHSIIAPHDNMNGLLQQEAQSDTQSIAQQQFSIVTQASIQADQPADDNSSLSSARQPDSRHLLQSTEVQQPADMSSNLNDHQGANQPSSTIQIQSLEEAQHPHDDMGSI